MFPAVWRLYYLVSRTTVPSSPADTRSATPGGIWRCSYRAECRSQSQPPLSATIDRTIDWLLDWLISFWWDGHLCVKSFFITNVRIYCKDDENEMHIMYTTIWIKSYWIIYYQHTLFIIRENRAVLTCECTDPWTLLSTTKELFGLPYIRRNFCY